VCSRCAVSPPNLAKIDALNTAQAAQSTKQQGMFQMNRNSPDRMIVSVPLVKIRVGDRSRSLCEDAVASLIESIKTIGLQVPISVQIDQ
jgi:hypothetical protein